VHSVSRSCAGVWYGSSTTVGRHPAGRDLPVKVGLDVQPPDPGPRGSGISRAPPR
jgi:hypothetical protein